MYKKILLSLLSLIIFIAFSVPSFADDVMEKTLHDGAYGGIIGGMAGAAVMALTDEPDEHLNYIANGAAIGLLGGIIYGLVAGTREDRYSGAEKEGFQLPAFQTVKTFDERTQKSEFIRIVNLIRYKF